MAAILVVGLALVVSGLPATAAPAPPTTKPSTPATTAPTSTLPTTAAPPPAAKPTQAAPDTPPVAPPLAPAEKALPAPPIPFAVPALPKPGEEILGLRTARSKSFATDKAGRYRTELYADPVNYKDAKGDYQEIDADLGRSQGGVRKSKANSFVLELADDASAAAVARVRIDDQVSVGFALRGAAGVKAKADNATSTYAGVTPGVDVHLTSRADGLKEELVLASAAAGDRFLFPLELKGLTAAVDANGDVVYRDKAGAERARTPTAS